MKPVTRRRLLRLLAASTLSLAAASVVGCGGGPAGPPPVIPREDAAKRVLRVGKLWLEQVADEGFLDNDPVGVASFRIKTTSKLELGPTGSARQSIEREETFRMQTGAEYRCTAKGPVPVEARYLWEGDDPRLELTTEGAMLPRTCDKPGFPVLEKEIPAGRTLFALRGDRLVAIEPARARNVLLPLQ